jgi:hypothetical protein
MPAKLKMCCERSYPYRGLPSQHGLNTPISVQQAALVDSVPRGLFRARAVMFAAGFMTSP